MPSHSYSGRVIPGRGLGSSLMSRPAVSGPIATLLGAPAVPGTLNLRLDERFDCQSCTTIDLTRLGISPREIGLDTDSIEYDVARVLIQGRIPGLLLHRRAPDYPQDMIELVCGVRLRDEFALADGDVVRFDLADPE